MGETWDLEQQVDYLQRVNERLHAKLKALEARAALDAEVAALQAQRPYLKPWEQAGITEMIDAAHEGRVVDGVPITRLMKEVRV